MKYNHSKELKSKSIVAEMAAAKIQREQIFESRLVADSNYQTFHSAGKMIAERKMSEEEILNLFSQVEQQVTAGGNNRTMLGKGKDATVAAAGKIQDGLSNIVKAIQGTTIVAGFDSWYDMAGDKILKAAGNDTAVKQYIDKYRVFAKKYPVTQGFIKAALIGATGLATGGAGLPAIVGIFNGVDSMVKGDKLSTVLGKGIGSAALAWAGKHLYDWMNTPDAAPTPTVAPVAADPTAAVTPAAAPAVAPVSVTVQPGDTLSQIAQQHKISVEQLVQANQDVLKQAGYSAANPDNVRQGVQLTIPSPTGAATYAGGVGTASNTAAGVANGSMPQSFGPKLNSTREVFSGPMIAEAIGFTARTMPKAKLFDMNMTLLTWKLDESTGKKHRPSVSLTESGIDLLFRNIEVYQKKLDRAIKESVIMELNPIARNGSDTRKKFKSAVAPAPTAAPQAPAAAPAPAPAAAGGPELPDELDPPMPGGRTDPTDPAQPKGFLDKVGAFGSKIGGALKRAGHQFTTKVTADKLKMNWHQLGKPTDSDAISDFLADQGIPDDVIASVFQGMNIPYTADARDQGATVGPAADPAAQGGAAAGAQAAPAAQDASQAAAPAAADPSSTALKAITAAWDAFVESGKGASPALRQQIKRMWLDAGGVKVENKKANSTAIKEAQLKKLKNKKAVLEAAVRKAKRDKGII